MNRLTRFVPDWLRVWFWQWWYGELWADCGCDNCNGLAVRKLNEANCPYIANWLVMYLCRDCWQKQYDAMKLERDRNDVEEELASRLGKKEIDRVTYDRLLADWETEHNY